MQNQIFRSSVKFMHGRKKKKKKKKNMVHLYIQLETFALILNSKIVFMNFFLG